MIAEQPNAAPPIADPSPGEDGTITYHERIALPARPVAPTISEPAHATSVPPARAALFVPGAPLLAAVQLLIGYQWLVSGVDKLLDGGFPDHLGALIAAVSANDRLPDVFTQFLQQVVLPSSFMFGVAVEIGETLIGAGLFGGALLVLIGPALRARLGARFPQRTFGVLNALTIVAAVMSLAMGANYFVLDGMPPAWFQPGFAVGGAIDTGLFLALGSLVILLGRATIRLSHQNR